MIFIKNGYIKTMVGEDIPNGAILMVKDPATGNLVPTVAEEVCVGCGACENLCPVRPVSAITVHGKQEHLS